MLSYILLAVISLLIGAAVGVIGFVRWWVWNLRKPENVRRMLKGMYRQSHPHWLQKSKGDDHRVCPCCGWSETEGLNVPAKTGTVCSDPECAD